MTDLLEKLARRMREKIAYAIFGKRAQDVDDELAAVLREVHLDELLEAGQAMRDSTLEWSGLYEAEGKAWDAAKKVFEESLG